MSTFEEMDRRLAQLPSVVARELRSAMSASLTLIETDARQTAARDTEHLASGPWVQTIRGSGIDLEGRVGPSARYGINVEFGRRAGAKAPPVAALIGWVTRHPFSGRGSIRSKAFVLARAIGRRGIRPRPFLVPAYRKNRTRIADRFGHVGAQVVAHLQGRAL